MHENGSAFGGYLGVHDMNACIYVALGLWQGCHGMGGYLDQ